jgi:hypothetical protein
MDRQTAWYASPAVQEAVKRFILALVILSLALLGYDVEITRASTTPRPAATEGAGW